MSQLPHLTLRGSLFAFIAFCLLIISAALGSFVYSKANRLTNDILNYTTGFRTTAAAEDLARSLEHDWSHLVSLADQVNDLDKDALAHLMKGVAGDGHRISWIGFADLTGTMIAASGPPLEGASVSSSAWFRGGLSQGFAGEMHDAAVPLTQAVKDQKPSFSPIAFAQPVRNGQGDRVGVLGMHINGTWLADHLRETAARFGIDLYLTDQNGGVSASSNHNMPTAAELQILRAAQVGVATEGRETWPDGKNYHSFLVPQVAHGDLPNFGWRMVGRLDASAFNLGAHLLFEGVHYVILVAFLLIGLLTALYARVIAAPFASLAASAERIADGSQEYLMDSGRTREVVQLASALTRLQLGTAVDAAPRRTGAPGATTVTRAGFGVIRQHLNAANTAWPHAPIRPLSGSAAVRQP